MKKIGIIGAMDVEVEELINSMTIEHKVTKAGMDFCEGTLNGAKVVVVKCGVGKVNSAICVQILKDEFDVSNIINTGVAGSLNADLNIGDILISKEAIHHDVDVSVFGYALGQVPSMIREFPADESMMKLAKEVCERVNPDISCVIGRVVSGDQFICKPEQKAHLKEEFQGDCAEMEGASIAHVAYLNEIPFVIIRAISDKADGSDIEDYPTFEKKAAKHCALFVKEFVKEYV